MKKNKFVGSPESVSFNFTEEEKRKAAESRKQFEAELLLELKGNAHPSPEEELDAVRRITKRRHEQNLAKKLNPGKNER